MHVGGHSRGGRHGTIDVSAYDRSSPGEGAAFSGDRAWERHSSAEFRDAIAKAERSAEHRNHGYRQYNDAGGGGGAFGRYQLRQGVLMDAGWMDNLGRWTGKAASHGVKNDVDFLDHPEAQEAAMTDVLRVYDRQARALGVDRYVGQVITGLNGSRIRITRAGIIAAVHRVGVAGVADSLARLTTNNKANNRKDKDRDTLVRKRLREFDRIAYQPEHK